MTPTATGVLVLIARRARRRGPSATVWTVLAYDPHARVPVVDLAQRWQPAGAGSGTAAAADPPAAVPEPVAQWVTEVLGRDTGIGGPADDLAGPGSWHLFPPRDGALSRRGEYAQHAAVLTQPPTSRTPKEATD